VDAAEPDGWGIRAKSLDGLGEPFGAEPGGFAVGAGFVDALAAVGDDQGDEHAGPDDHAEGKLHQDEKCFRIEFLRGVDLLEVQQVHQAVEDSAGHQNRGHEGDGQGPADLPEPQLPVIGRPRPSIRCHEQGDSVRRRYARPTKGSATDSAPALEWVTGLPPEPKRKPDMRTARTLATADGSTGPTSSRTPSYRSSRRAHGRATAP